MGGAVLSSHQYLISHFIPIKLFAFLLVFHTSTFLRRPLQYYVGKHTHIRGFECLKLLSNLTAEQLCAGMSKKNRLKMAFRGVSLTHFPKSVVYTQWSHPGPQMANIMLRTSTCKKYTASITWGSIRSPRECGHKPHLHPHPRPRSAQQCSLQRICRIWEICKRGMGGGGAWGSSLPSEFNHSVQAPTSRGMS